MSGFLRLLYASGQVTRLRVRRMLKFVLEGGIVDSSLARAEGANAQLERCTRLIFQITNLLNWRALKLGTK